MEPTPCTHRTASDSDACAPFGEDQYQCLLCGATTSDFQNWQEVDEPVVDTAPEFGGMIFQTA